MAAIKARGETAFQSKAVSEIKDEKGVVIQEAIPAGAIWSAGKDVVLCFKNSDLKRIESPDVLGPDWFSDLIEVGQRSIPTIATMEILVKHGAKLNREPYEVSEEVLDTIPVLDLGEVLLDAACMSQKGKTLKEYLTDAFEAFAAAAQSGEVPSPPSPDTTLLTNSESAVSGPASE